MITTKDMIPLHEVSRELNRSLEQVRRYVREGKLRANKIGMQWFVTQSDLNEYKSVLQNTTVSASHIIARARAVREKIKAQYGEMDGLELLDETRNERLQEL